MSPSLMMLRRMKCGRCFTSSKILAMYSPMSPSANRLIAPKNRTASDDRRKPFGADGRKQSLQRELQNASQRRPPGTASEIAEHVQRRIAEGENTLLCPPDVLAQAVGGCRTSAPGAHNLRRSAKPTKARTPRRNRSRSGNCSTLATTRRSIARNRRHRAELEIRELVEQPIKQL